MKGTRKHNVRIIRERKRNTQTSTYINKINYATTQEAWATEYQICNCSYSNSNSHQPTINFHYTHSHKRHKVWYFVQSVAHPMRPNLMFSGCLKYKPHGITFPQFYSLKRKNCVSQYTTLTHIAQTNGNLFSLPRLLGLWPIHYVTYRIHCGAYRFL